MAQRLPPSFLIDAHLPSKVPCWSGPRFLPVRSFHPEWSNEETWSSAQQHQCTSVPKDKDFSVLQMAKGSPPKWVHIKLGNQLLHQFIDRVPSVWPQVELLVQHNSVINIYLDKIEAIK